ncbi:sugar ABC transporter substrate-binding protein [Luxibacter massiliensis]|uniref:sugar ABC transporter substrate-binding protein n=1 Tax=Luxibacter massiliensis TaxID=2219695 RepID=UPI000F0451AC|nr:sugar ABC transporter substrate-binding protein [Luxibacter massiliensis]
MKAKRISALLLAVIMTVSLAACTGSEGGGSAGDSASSGGAADKKRVCFVARASADTFAAWLTTEMKKEAEEYENIELTCVSGEGDDNKENGLLEDCVTKNYDLVIVQSNNNAAQAPYVQQLIDAGIPVITTNPTTHQSDLDGSDDDSVMEGTGTVDADPIAQAKVSADRAVDEIPENANVVVLNGPSGNFHADKRREAWTEYFFDKRSDVKILYEDYANWNSDEALTLMESWVQSGTHIDAIISMNDNMAAGAIEAIRDNPEYIDEDGTPNFLAYGVDGTAQGCLLIQEGLLTSTALQSAADLAKKNMEYAAKVVEDEMEVTDVNDYVDAPEINKDNVQEYIQIYIDNGEITDDGSLSE